MAVKKSYALSKTKVRDMISERFEGRESELTLDAVLALFDGKSGGNAGSTTIVYNDEGEVIAKRCSYFGVYFDISEFGKRGDTYSYQSKLAESLVRKARTEASNMKKLADDELADAVIDVNEWREKLSEIEELKDSRTEISDIEDAPEHFEDAEAAKAALA